MGKDTLTRNDSRRDFIKKAAYVVPAILSLNVALVAARAGSPMQEGGKGGAPARGQRPDGTPQRRSRTGRDGE